MSNYDRCVFLFVSHVVLEIYDDIFVFLHFNIDLFYIVIFGNYKNQGTSSIQLRKDVPCCLCKQICILSYFEAENLCIACFVLVHVF